MRHHQPHFRNISIEKEISTFSKMRLYYSFGWINQNIFTHKAFYTYLCLIDDPYSFSHFIGEVYITKGCGFLTVISPELYYCRCQLGKKTAEEKKSSTLWLKIELI